MARRCTWPPGPCPRIRTRIRTRPQLLEGMRWWRSASRPCPTGRARPAAAQQCANGAYDHVEQNALLGLGVRDHAGNPADQATHHQPDEEVHAIALEKKLRLVVKGNRRAWLLQAVQSLGLAGAVSWSEAGRSSARSASLPEGVWASRPRSGDSLTWGRSAACSINSSMMERPYSCARSRSG